MKVSSTSSTTATAGSSGPRPAAEGFGDLLNVGGTAPRAAASGVSGAAGVSGISALLALQGIGGPEARARALRKGRRLLDALDRLQLAIRLAACATQPPGGAEFFALRFKVHLRQAFGRVAAHHLIRLVIAVTRRAAIQRQRHRIQQRRFPRARRPRDEKHARRTQRPLIKPHLMRPAERVEVLEADGEEAHVFLRC